MGITIERDQARHALDRLTDSELLRQLEGIDMWLRR
jgi:hypothetical protein